jgi:hypothetical protein
MQLYCSQKKIPIEWLSPHKTEEPSELSFPDIQKSNGRNVDMSNNDIF